MAIDIKYTARVTCPVKTVFETVTDIPRMVEWSSAREIHVLTKGPIMEGTRFELVTDFMGVEYCQVYTVTAIEPNQKFTYRSSGFGANESSMTFDPTDEGTLITFKLSVKVSSLLAPAVKGGISKTTESNLIRLVELLEEGR